MSDMLLKAVFWDLDGTLIDSEPYWHEGEMEIAAAHGGYWDEDLAWSCSGTPLDHCAKTMIEHGTNLPPEQIAKAMVDYVAKKEFERVPWTNGVLDVLGSLVDAGIPSVLVTTSPRRLAQNVIDHAPAGAFAGFVCGDDDLPHKPDPAPYLAAAKMLGVSVTYLNKLITVGGILVTPHGRVVVRSAAEWANSIQMQQKATKQKWHI